MSEAALTTALRTVRLAIGDSGKEQRLIRTVVRHGYRFVGTVTQAEARTTPDVDGEVPLPPRLARSSGFGFTGREHERSVLVDAWKTAAEGALQVVLVSGEAGIGKTTLCSVVATAAHHDGAVVLYGRCDEELSIPYQPWREVLAGLDQHLPEVLAGHREALATLMGGEGAADLDSDSARFALNSAVVDVLDAVSSRGQPALVVLDDLHWADGQTLALVRHLVERAPATPALVVGTFRDTDIDASHP
ncbi:hypothetical protein B7486_68200, partial [cyanobacterium TDX16]